MIVHFSNFHTTCYPINCRLLYFIKLEVVKQLFVLFQRGNDYSPHYNNCKNWTELRPIHYFGSKCMEEIAAFLIYSYSSVKFLP